MMQNLFNVRDNEKNAGVRPLADRMRPESLDEFFGQNETIGIIQIFIQGDKFPSMIFWGPPGTGKTTIAHIIAKKTKSFFLPLSAVTSNIPEVKKKIAEASDRLSIYGQKTIIFVDEIHRFNKLQQDAFLPYVEDGTIILIGATTENPSFEVTSALLSRCKILVLGRLSDNDLMAVIKRAANDKKKGLGNLNLELSKDGMDYLINYADGDARRALNLLEETAGVAQSDSRCKGDFRCIDSAALSEISQKSSLLYDKKGEEHYNLISALHKCMRDSDPDAALYWLGRMLAAGEDGLYIARRLIRFASEDIGNADFRALLIATAAKDAFHFMGRSEGDLALAQAVVFLAQAKKNNDLYIACGKVKKDIDEFGSLPVPMHLRNAPSKLMKDLGYSEGYKYAHNYKDAKADQEHFPKEMGKRIYLK